jgi:hypothetical protein
MKFIDRKVWGGATALLLACTASLATAQCNDHTPLRRAYFGDIHVHTSYSLDAAWRMGAQATPDDAYRFAKGAEISLPPFDAAGNSDRKVQLDRPLDFAMVADHAESLATVRYCSEFDAEEDKPWLCDTGPMALTFAGMLGRVVPGISIPCADDSPECLKAGAAVWQDTISAAQQHQDDCEFTAFIGYEWSGSAGRSNMHRNVVFRSDAVLARPISSRDEKHVEGLWQRLDEQCRDGGKGCEALTIPHNANLSQGKMFSELMSNGEALTAEVAERRARYERLAEIIQHKGASECYYGAGMEADELCAFERLSFSTFAGKYFPLLREEPANDSRYLRNALRNGLALEKSLQVNPFAFGFIGSTDTHVAASGAVAENYYVGHHGDQKMKENIDKPQFVDVVEQNGGGLAVLYAEENTRASLFDAMRRREAYATSGPRIGLRMFGAWDLPGNLCEQTDLVEQGYRQGVPMGATLRPPENAQAPRFVVAASADPGTRNLPGTPLKHVQIIKAWLDKEGNSHEKIYEIAGDAKSTASVNLDDCSQTGQGHQRLCAVWQDPDFNADDNALYYSRVIENPSCRWQQYVCNANNVSCDSSENIPEEFSACCDGSVPKTINERAWSSPIWVSSDRSKGQSE